MRIVITGSRGFVGSNLVNSLKKDHYIIGINRNLDKNCNESYAVNLANISEVQQAFSKIRADILIHCAAIAAPKPTPETVSNIIDCNVKSALNIRYSYSGPIINFSSVVIYGTFSEDRKTYETDNKDPISTYGLSKKLAEDIFDFYGNTLHIRPGNMIGPNLTHGVIKDVISRLNEDNFYVFGKKPGTKKSYLHISDIISFIDIILNDLSLIEMKNVNLVNDDTITIEELVLECMKVKNIKRDIIWDESKVWVGDNIIINASNNKAKKIFNWQPKLNSLEAVKKAVEENVGQT